VIFANSALVLVKSHIQHPMAPCRSAFETLVRLAVVEQIADAVYRVLENRSSGKYDHSDLWINKGNDVDGGYESGDLTSEAEVFE
jgi:hypothetical protein